MDGEVNGKDEDAEIPGGGGGKKTVMVDKSSQKTKSNAPDHLKNMFDDKYSNEMASEFDKYQLKKMFLEGD